MPFVKGQSGNPNGRKAGSQNKITADIKAAILESFSRVGAEEYLVKQATENPQAYLTLIGKVLPLQVSADVSGKININVIRRG